MSFTKKIICEFCDTEFPNHEDWCPDKEKKQTVEVGNTYLSANQEKFTVIAVIGEWCMVKQENKKPIVEATEFILAHFNP